MTTNGTNKLLAQVVIRLVLLLATAARFIPLVLLAFVIIRHTRSAKILAGAPKLEGLSILGVILLSLRHGASEVVARLLDLAIDGVSYASVAGNVLVFVHDAEIIRQLLAMPEQLVSR